MTKAAGVRAALALLGLGLLSLGCGSGAPARADAKADATAGGSDAANGRDAADGGLDTRSDDHAAVTDGLATDGLATDGLATDGSATDGSVTDDAKGDATPAGSDAALALDAADAGVSAPTCGDAAATGMGGDDASVGATCQAPSPDAVWVSQDPSSVSPAVRNRVANVFAIRPDDVWVTVSGFQDQETLLKTPPELWTWNGTSFNLALRGVVNQPFSPPIGQPDSRFDRIWASGPNDVWVTGERLRHWDGAAWSDRTPPGADQVVAIHGRGPNDIWVDAFKPGGQIDRFLLLHWNGCSWIDMTPPPLDPATTLVFGGGTWASVSTQLVPPPIRPDTVGVFSSGTIWESAPDDVWVPGGTEIPAPPPSTGFQGNADVLQHWDGRAWTALAGTSHPVFSIWGSSPTDVWTAGYTLDHFDGHAWATVVVPPDIARLWGSCATDVWAGFTEQGQAWHFDGTSWTVDPSAPFEISSISGTSADDLWVVWGVGNLAHRTLSPGTWAIIRI